MSVKLRIGLIWQGGAAWMGGAEYTRNMLKALYRLPAEDQTRFEVRVLAEGRLDAALYSDMPPRFRQELHHELATTRAPLWRRVAARLAARQGRAWLAAWTSLARQAHRLGIDFLYPFNHGAGDTGAIATAAWIPDFQHQHLPALFSQEELAQRDQLFAAHARHASAVVLSSQDAAQDFRRIYPTHAYKARVLSFRTAADDFWYEGRDAEPLTVTQRYGLPERFFIVCNQFWRHKNHRVIFEALRILQVRGLHPTVVCTGKLEDYRHPTYAGEIMQMLHDYRLGDQVRLLGLIPRLDQIQLMRQALAVLQPSLFEGWSTVVEDSRVLAKGIALSDLAVHREQDPPGAVFFDANDVERLTAIMADWWRHLSAGPDREREKQARQSNRQEVVSYGRQILALAQGVREHHGELRRRA